jgi:hypothetical protein
MADDFAELTTATVALSGIPGHGRLCDEADLVEYRDMITIIRDRMFAVL